MIFHIIWIFLYKTLFLSVFSQHFTKLESDNAKQTKINGYQPDLLGPQKENFN